MIGCGRIVAAAMLVVALLSCARGRAIPPGSPDQTRHDAMVLVCDAPIRARAERGMAASDAVALHLADGVGNLDVLAVVEGWKTSGSDRAEPARLVRDAKLGACALQQALP